MLNELFLLQIFTLITLFFFINTFNLISLWYLAGIYLVFLGIWLFLDDGDIFVGFLWVIDLGVGLIFFIFILHYSSFTHQKISLDKSSRETLFSLVLFFWFIGFFFFLSQPNDSFFNAGLKKTWFFFITWYDYYTFTFTFTITDLSILRDIYFYNNSWEFFLINFVLFYGIVTSILLSFLIKRFFTFLNVAQFFNNESLYQINATYFLRNQNYLKQQSKTTGTRVWKKKKSNTLNDY